MRCCVGDYRRGGVRGYRPSGRGVTKMIAVYSFLGIAVAGLILYWIVAAPNIELGRRPHRPAPGENNDD